MNPLKKVLIGLLVMGILAAGVVALAQRESVQTGTRGQGHRWSREGCPYQDQIQQKAALGSWRDQDQECLGKQDDDEDGILNHEDEDLICPYTYRDDVSEQDTYRHGNFNGRGNNCAGVIDSGSI